MKRYIQGHKHRLGCFNIKYEIEEIQDKRFEVIYSKSGQPSAMAWFDHKPTEEEIIELVRTDNV